MKLSCLLENVEYKLLAGSAGADVRGLKYDSRQVCPGDVFVCISGAVSDGHRFIPDVIKKGASSIVCERDVTGQIEVPGGVTLVLVADCRDALASMSAAFFGHPAERLKTIGITGTKGKTTTTYMIKSALENAGIKTGLIGTIETVIGGKHIPAENTTPESFVVQKTFKEMADAGCECVVMEVSSQGLKQKRVGGFVFDIGVFTNISPDHIGKNEHKDFDEYLECKSMLLRQCRTGIVNIDDSHTDRVLEGHTCDVETFGIENDADYTAKNIRLYKGEGTLGIKYDLAGRINEEISIDVPGRFSAYNSLCAIAVCLHFSDDFPAIKSALSDIKVKGRVEIVPISKRFTIMIDYAHNAMSLESLLKSLREYDPGRIVTVFGCGGNRDRNRRFEMGEVSSRLADLSIITSDNPRDEEPMAIIDDIITGVRKADGEFVTIPDRIDAIRYSILNARDGDVIVLAGKGHEDYQIIKGVKHPMDERVIIADLVKEDAVAAVL